MGKNKRNLNNEYQDSKDRKYAYDFDYILRDYMMKQFEPFMKGCKTVLEMGCYKGEFTKKLMPYFSKVTVLEGSSDLIEEAKRNVGDDKKVKFIHSMFEDWTPDEKYDAIFLSHTLEHIDKPVELLKKIKTAISDEGYLFLIVPNGDAASRQIAVNMGIIDYNTAVTQGEFEHGHRRTYNLDKLENEARQAGMDVLHKGGIFFKPFANFQFDKLLNSGIIDKGYMDGCYKLGFRYPELSASIFLLCR